MDKKFTAYILYIFQNVIHFKESIKGKAIDMNINTKSLFPLGIKLEICLQQFLLIKKETLTDRCQDKSQARGYNNSVRILWM